MPRSASLIRYSINTLTRALARPGLPYASVVKTKKALASARAELPKAVLRELKALARMLTYKADIYTKHGRIYSHSGKWSVAPDGTRLRFTQRGGMVGDFLPDELTDGHGRAITAISGL